ncbi:hypothetical protein [Azospirillum sp. sgz302134]
MDSSAFGPILNAAVNQQDRRRAAPAPDMVRLDTVRMDGRGLAERLAFAAEYGRLITFHDLADQADGDWSAFFASDPSIALAVLIALDLPAIEDRFRRGLHDLRRLEGRSQRRSVLKRLVEELVRLLRLLDDGHSALGKVGREFARTIRAEIADALAPRLLPVAVHLAAAPDWGPKLNLEGFSVHWGLRAIPNGLRALPGFSRDWLDGLIPLLEDLTDALLGTLRRIVAEARTEFEASLQTPDHAPQAALCIAFATLYGDAQGAVNGFADRLVDFYHGRILRQDSRAALPARVFLTFTAARGVTVGSVPEGTRFPAGPAGAYAAERSLEVHTAALSTLRTLRVVRALPVTGGEACGDEATPETPAPARVLCGTLSLSDKAPRLATPFPLFGAEDGGGSDAHTSTPASLGFAIASPVLMLTGGARTVRVRLTIARSSLRTVTPLLESIGRRAGTGNNGSLLALILQSAFRLYHSTGGGWVPVAGHSVAPPASPALANPTLEDGAGEAAQDTTFTLAFTLPDGAPPFVAPSTLPVTKDAIAPAPGMPVPDADRPALLAVFGQEAVPIGQNGRTVTVHPYAVLSQLRLSRLRVEVEVAGFTGLTLSSAAIPPDPGTPFALFGSPPVPGAGVDIAAPELFAKRLNRLDIGFRWFGLPQNATGFQGYYQGYVVDADGTRLPPGTLFTNRSFRAAFSVSGSGWWCLEPTAGGVPTACLFRTDETGAEPAADAPVLPETVFSGLKLTEAKAPAGYDPAASVLRVTLSSPPDAFGDAIYARNVMAAALRTLPSMAARAEACACACADSAEVAEAASLFDPLQAANNDAPDDSRREQVSAALVRCLSILSVTALKMVNDGLVKLDPEAAGMLRSGLVKMLSTTNGGSLWHRLSGNGGRQTSAVICSNLLGWISHNASIPEAAGDLDRAKAVLNAAATVAQAFHATVGEPAPVARPVLAAALLAAKSRLTQYHAVRLQACLDADAADRPGMSHPNPPWLPRVSAVTVDYGAADAAPDGIACAFHHILPFGGTEPADWIAENHTVPLLAPVEAEGTLLVGLGGVPPEGLPGTFPRLTLLAQLAPGKGGWSDRPAPVRWEKRTATGWTPLTAQDGLEEDGTDGLRNSGIVTLGLSGFTPAEEGLAWLRLRVDRDAHAFPRLAGLTPNALTAVWVGPEGAERLDEPLPAGTITASAPALPDIAAVAQPMPSLGGRSVASGPAFRTWMAERLRHRNRAIQDWDYARLVLADHPSLWQAAVVPAGTGGTMPGQVRLVVVPGPDMPDAGDATAPLAGPAVLAAVREGLAARIGPFVALSVENPSYVRITVKATLVFRDGDTPAALGRRLSGELVAWLSPWPPPSELGERPSGYWTKAAIADFIRRRPYVAAIHDFSLAYDPPDGPPDGQRGCHYLTSALVHAIEGTTERSARLPAWAEGAEDVP